MLLTSVNRGASVVLHLVALTMISREAHWQAGTKPAAHTGVYLPALGSFRVKTQCICGFDCTDFIGQHAIPANSHLSCPSCEARLNVTDGDIPATSEETRA